MNPVFNLLIDTSVNTDSGGGGGPCALTQLRASNYALSSTLYICSADCRLATVEWRTPTASAARKDTVSSSWDGHSTLYLHVQHDIDKSLSLSVAKSLVYDDALVLVLLYPRAPRSPFLSVSLSLLAVDSGSLLVVSWAAVGLPSI